MVKRFKKIVAIATACALVITPVSVHAEGETSAEGSTTGNSQLEGIIDKDIFSVVLPTIAVDDTTFDFIIDPQGLIAATGNAAYPDATFNDADKGVFFKNDDATYSSTSNSLTATNKGTSAVDVTLSATAGALTDDAGTYDIQLADSAAFTSSNTTTSLYLALVSGTETAALTADGASISTTLASAPSDAYEVKYENGAYSYGLTAAAEAADYTGFDSLDFNLTGACNMNADWTAAKDATPTVEVVWELKKYVEPPVSDGTTAIVIEYTGDTPAAGSLTFTKPDGTTWTPGAGQYTSNIKIAAGTLTLTTTWLSSLVSTPGTYSVSINGTSYPFVIGELVSIPESDGTTEIVISYTGADPAAGSLTFTKPDGTTWTPGTGQYTSNIKISSGTLTLTTTWLSSLVSAPGTYSVSINGTSYSFIIK